MVGDKSANTSQISAMASVIVPDIRKLKLCLSEIDRRSFLVNYSLPTSKL